jgi:hypothetical protein
MAGVVGSSDVFLVVAAADVAGDDTAGEPAGGGAGAHVDGQLDRGGAAAELEHDRGSGVHDEGQGEGVGVAAVGTPGRTPSSARTG